MNRLKIACFICACLFLMIIVMCISTLRDVVYSNFPSVQRSHDMKGSGAVGKKQQTSDISLLLSDRLQQGDLENGRKIFRQCAICHTSKGNEFRRIGPTLWEIVNRPFASITGFTYSRVLRANSDKKWDFVTLDHYLQSPRKAFPGTIMSFRGLKNDQDRADLLLYLRSLSDNPASLPTNDKTPIDNKKSGSN
ncbi:c-type cytochrome [Bartonella sp. B41]